MTIAIAGDGLCGAYLYRRLKRNGIDDVQVYGSWRKIPNKCGITSCGWGAAGDITDYIRRVHLDPSKYILDRIYEMDFEGVSIKIDMVMFDKPRLIKDMLGDHIPIRFAVDRKEADTIIDATGTARVYLPKICDDLIAQCSQLRRTLRIPLERKVIIRFVKDGYMWVFPLGGDHAHIGYGGIMGDGKHVPALKEISESKLYTDLVNVAAPDQRNEWCGCHSSVRITSPARSLPFHIPWGDENGKKDWIIGVGEAIGAVSPISGEGNVPGLKTCEILLDSWGDPELYTAAVLKEFGWMTQERELLDKMKGGYKPSVNDLRVVQKNAKRMGIGFTTHSVMTMCKKFMSG